MRDLRRRYGPVASKTAALRAGLEARNLGAHAGNPGSRAACRGRRISVALGGADGASTPALRPPTGHHHCVRTEEPARPSAANPRRRPVDELTSRVPPSHSVSPPPSGSSSELASSVSPSSTALVGSSGRFRLAAKALAPASVGIVHTISPAKAAAVYEGISMIATRAHARLSTAKGRRMGESPRVCCQLAAHRRTPPTSNNTASAIAPAIGRAGTGVRSATIENWSAVAGGRGVLPGPPRRRAEPDRGTDGPESWPAPGGPPAIETWGRLFGAVNLAAVLAIRGRRRVRNGSPSRPSPPPPCSSARATRRGPQGAALEASSRSGKPPVPGTRRRVGRTTAPGLGADGARPIAAAIGRPNQRNPLSAARRGGRGSSVAGWRRRCEGPSPESPLVEPVGERKALLPWGYGAKWCGRGRCSRPRPCR